MQSQAFFGLVAVFKLKSTFYVSFFSASSQYLDKHSVVYLVIFGRCKTRSIKKKKFVKKGGQWPSGRVLDSRPQVPASPASLRCGP